MAKRKHHFRRAGSRGPSYKTLGLAAVAGVAGVVGIAYAQAKVPFVRDHWYVAPAAAGLGAVVLARKMPAIAVALAAVAGIFAYTGYQASSAAAQASSGTTTNQGASGFTDAGAMRRMAVRRDSGLFERNGNAGALQGARAGQLLFEQAGSLQGPGNRAIRTSSAAGLRDY